MWQKIFAAIAVNVEPFSTDRLYNETTIMARVSLLEGYYNTY